MAEENAQTAFAALTHLINYDKTIAFDPVRVRAALLDVAAHDHLGVELVVTSVRLGIPRLVTDGDPGAALNVLTVHGGYRPDVAAGLVTAWQHSFGLDTADGAATTAQSPYSDLAATLTPAGTLGAVAHVDCHVWPDGSVTALALGMDGLCITTLTPPVSSQPTPWFRAAEPQAPMSRSAALVGVSRERLCLLWTDNSGIWSQTIRNSPDTSTLEVAGVTLADRPDVGQARYPLTAVAVDDSEIDTFWTATRRDIVASTRDGLGANERRDVPSPCVDGERLVALDCTTASDTTAWLAALTDRGRLAIARWDVPSGEHDGWRTVRGPLINLTTMAAVRLSAGASVVVGDTDGDLFAVDCASAYADKPTWKAIEFPDAGGRLTGLNALGASSAGDIAWLIAHADRGVALIRAHRYEEAVEASEVVWVSRTA